MLTADQLKELDADIKGLVDKQVEEKLAKEIIKRFSPGEAIVTKDAGDQPWKSLGEQLMAVKNFAISQGQIRDARLKAPTGLEEGIPAEGGFLVQTDYATTLLEKTFAASDIINRVFRIPISANANSIKIPAVADSSRADGSRAGGILAYWAGEGGTKTPTYPRFAQVALELKKLVGLTYCTDELLQDMSALEAWIQRAFANEFDFKISDAIINGDGAAKPLGILNSPCLVSVTKVTGQGTSTIVAENIIAMWARRFGPNSANYVWLYNQDIEPQLSTMGIAVGAGGIGVWMPAGGLSGLPYNTLYGRPMIPCEQCAQLGTVGDIILADLSQYVMIDKGGLQSASSIHVLFTTDETAFRFVYRCDGQPMWAAPLTPYKGTGSTQSPFVVIPSDRS